MTSEIDIAAKRIELEKQKQHIEAQLAMVCQEIALIEPILQEFFLENATKIESLKLAGGTVYTQVQIWPKRLVDNDTLYKKLKEVGWDYLVNDSVNGQQLAAQVREHIKENGELPKELEGVLEANPTVKIKVKTSS